MAGNVVYIWLALIFDTLFTAINNTKSKENRSKINITPYFINYLTKIKFKFCMVTFFKGFCHWEIMLVCLFDFCFTALQHILGHFGRGQLPSHCSWASLLGSLPVLSCLVHILSPVTDNCSSRISGRGRMAVEFFSWPSLHERMCRTWDWSLGRLHVWKHDLQIIWDGL